MDQLQPITSKLHCKLLFSQNIRDDESRFSASSVFVLVQQIVPKGQKKQKGYHFTIDRTLEHKHWGKKFQQ